MLFIGPAIERDVGLYNPVQIILKMLSVYLSSDLAIEAIHTSVTSLVTLSLNAGVSSSLPGVIEDKTDLI